MIFDLKSGKRRRVIQVVFGFLAFIFFISFVGFGIGSDVSGGIFDAIGLGGGDSASTPEYEQQIEDANETLETDPENERALLDLAGAYFRSATETGITVNPETGVIEISEDSRSDLEQSIAAWERYQETKPQRVDTTAAAQAAESYRYLLDADGAAEAQRIVAEAQDSSSAYAQLAIYLYADGQIKQGDAAGDRAVEAAEQSQRQAIRRNMDALAEQARKQKQRLAEQQAQGGAEGGAGAGAQGIEDPFGGLSGAGGAAPLPAPAP
jgi:ribosome-associated translation inhibitor RaiA